MKRWVAAVFMLLAGAASIATSPQKWRISSKAFGSVALPAGSDRASQTLAVEASHGGIFAFRLFPKWTDPSEPGASVVVRLVSHSGATPVDVPLTPSTPLAPSYGVFWSRPPRSDFDVIVERTGGKQSFELAWDAQVDVSEIGDKPPPGAFVTAHPVSSATP